MPAVGMRRTTRVFGARVLRSGRRLWTAEPGEVGKQQHHKRPAANAEVELIEILDDSVDETEPCKVNGRHDDTFGLNQEASEMEIDENTAEHQDRKIEKRWGAVYQRKRKRLDMKIGVVSLSNSDKRYGKQFFRKQGKKRLKESPAVGGSHTCIRIAAVVETSSCGSGSLVVFSCFLNSILRYMRRVSLRLRRLSAFLFSKPITRVYSSHGIHFLQDCTKITGSGICKIMGSRCRVPMFLLDFWAVPSVFLCLHSSLLIRCATLSYALVLYSNGLEAEGDSMTDDEELPSCIPCEGGKSRSKTEVSGHSNSGKRKAVQRSAAAPKSAARTLQLRNTIGSRSIQKRRSSLRLRRVRNLSPFVVRKANRAVLTDLSFRHDVIPFSPITSNHEFISHVRKIPMTNVKELKSTSVGLMDDVDTSSCSANILVIESDKCYREEGATITLENSASNQWFVSIKRDGIRRYDLEAQKIMRPCSCNRITHAIIWTTDNGWKLEFPNRIDWLIFKKLYKECSDLNVRAPPTSFIPVPGVLEVSTYSDNISVPFRRPRSYITWKDDELTRALGKGTANYDLDSDDELWLNKFNNEHFPENELDHVSSDVFELIINSFEKGIYCGQDDYSDVRAAVDLCMNLERKDVLEAVHGYWMKKRKQKRSALARVFQCYQPRRTQLLPKAILRKKRSFKRQASKTGRGKQRTFLQAMAAERETVDEKNTILKVQEAKAASSRSEGMAVHKRQRAQVLMETADMAAYKATMALRIAEAARLDPPKAFNYFFLG